MIKEVKERFCAWVWAKLKQKKITQRQIAKIFHVTPSRVSQKLRSGDFTLEEIILIFAVVGATEREIGEILHVKDYQYSL